jgi:hypothetical protein
MKEFTQIYWLRKSNPSLKDLFKDIFMNLFSTIIILLYNEYTNVIYLKSWIYRRYILRILSKEFFRSKIQEKNIHLVKRNLCNMGFFDEKQVVFNKSVYPRTRISQINQNTCLAILWK